MRLDDWTTVTRVQTVEAPTNDAALIATTARRLLRAYAPPRPVRLLGVRVAAFADGDRPAGTAEPLPAARRLSPSRRVVDLHEGKLSLSE